MTDKLVSLAYHAEAGLRTLTLPLPLPLTLTLTKGYAVGVEILDNNG